MDKAAEKVTGGQDFALKENSDQLEAQAKLTQGGDPKIEDRILRKYDYHILPWLFGIWLCAFIDRSNIGNARIDGLTEDLHLRGNMFNVVLCPSPSPKATMY